MKSPDSRSPRSWLIWSEEEVVEEASSLIASRSRNSILRSVCGVGRLLRYPVDVVAVVCTALPTLRGSQRLVDVPTCRLRATLGDRGRRMLVG